jgi:hypothetical protein
VGTDTPGGKLQVNGGRAFFAGSNENYTVGIGRESNTNSYYLGVHSTTDPNLLFSNNAGTTNMTLTYSGNLGLGVTPSAWNSLFKALDFSTTASLAGAAGSANLFNNAYWDGSQYVYKTNAEATRYLQASGEHIWYTAGSGTAGGGISFTQAMTLTASGNLGVGTASPGVNGIDILKSSGTSTYVRTSDGAYTMLSGVAPALGGALISTTTNHPVFFYTNNLERARITAGGDLLVGTTSDSVSSGDGCKIIGSGVTTGPNVVTAYTTDAQVCYRAYSTGAGAYRFFVGWGGNIYATSASIIAISDQRLKENIRDLDVGLDAVMALKPRKFDWKEGKGADIKDARGFIAQEFEEVFPDLVKEWLDPTPEGEEPYKSVRQDLIPVLVKSIQEQQAMIEDLKAKVAALEAK